MSKIRLNYFAGTHLKKYLLITLITWKGLTCFAQEVSPRNEVPLSTYLNELETHFNVSFTYLENDVKSVVMPPKPVGDFPDIDEALRYLERETSLQFLKVDARYISIRKQANETTVNQFCGYLVDQQTGSPVAYALIEAGSGIYTSDSLGYFSFELEADSIVVSLSHIAYSDHVFMPVRNSIERIVTAMKITNLSIDKCTPGRKNHKSIF